MMPLYLFSGVITNQEERIEYTAKLLGYPLPLENSERQLIKGMLDKAARAAEKTLLNEVSMIMRK